MERSGTPGTTSPPPPRGAIGPRSPVRQRPDDPLRQFVHAAVGFVCLFLVIRAVAFEPFGVPSGSMAVTLVGNHRGADCPACGYRVEVGLSAARGRAAEFPCPNCRTPVDLGPVLPAAGDRLLVDKTAFAWRPPRRWEVAVFRCPVDDAKPYVKRVVGLPGEAVQIADGDVYVDGRLARKTLAEARVVRVPVFDTRFAPPGGWADRWEVSPSSAADAVFADGGPTLGGDAGPVGMTYVHPDDVVRAWVGYNGRPNPSRTRPLSALAPPAHDFFVECLVDVGPGAGVLSLRLGDGGEHVTADLPVGPGPEAEYRLTADRSGVRSAQVSRPLAAGRHRVEFAVVDRRAGVAVGGREVISSVELPPDLARGGVRRPLQIGAAGATVRVAGLVLYRDVYYRADGRNGASGPCRLGADEYFVLGDNAADSHDSREWAVPGVPRAAFVGKPFLAYRPPGPGWPGRPRWLR